MFSLRTDAALLMVQFEEAQWVMKADGTGFHPVWTSTLCYSIKNYFFKCSTSLHNILSNFFLTVEPDTSARKKLIFPPISDGFK